MDGNETQFNTLAPADENAETDAADNAGASVVETASAARTVPASIPTNVIVAARACWPCALKHVSCNSAIPTCERCSASNAASLCAYRTGDVPRKTPDMAANILAAIDATASAPDKEAYHAMATEANPVSKSHHRSLLWLAFRH